VCADEQIPLSEAHLHRDIAVVVKRTFAEVGSGALTFRILRRRTEGLQAADGSGAQRAFGRYLDDHVDTHCAVLNTGELGGGVSKNPEPLINNII
jgi:hypothetical protein